MTTSDSEDFESADEGQGSVEKKERKKRNSSSNFSDNASETDIGHKNVASTLASKKKAEEKLVKAEGWDDFDVEDSEPVTIKSSSKPEDIETNTQKQVEKSQDTGWDDFEDWGDDNSIQTTQPRSSNNLSQDLPSQHDKDLKQMTDKLAAMSATPPSSGWGWGWGVDSILSTASAGFSNLTNQVSQGITTVLETGIGAPDPEELARMSVQQKREDQAREKTPEEDKPETKTEESGDGDGAFDPFGSILKFVGSTGSKVITGGLDTLETIGRKTIEVLQDGDPYLAKKRALLGLDPAKPVLSQVLREAKAKAEEEDKVREERREAKEIHYERLFDDFEGLVHLEALEMLAKQVNMKIEERLQNAPAEKKYEIKETLQQVSELCEIPEDDDDEELEEADSSLPADEAFHEQLQKATKDLGVKLQFQNIVKQYKENLDWLSNPESEVTLKHLHKRCIGSLARATALAVEMYHKAAEMLLVKSRRMTADESDAMTQLTQVLCKHISALATLYTTKIDSTSTSEDAGESKDCITNIFLQAGNSETYIKNAFILTHPILQIGAI